MDDIDLKEFHDLAWSKLPGYLKTQSVDALKKLFEDEPELAQEIMSSIAKNGLSEWTCALPEEEFAMPFHFSDGMAIRNYLRNEVVRDVDLPGIPEYYGSDYDGGNWDDYYAACIEAALGFREIN